MSVLEITKTYNYGRNQESSNYVTGVKSRREENWQEICQRCRCRLFCCRPLKNPIIKKLKQRFSLDNLLILTLESSSRFCSKNRVFLSL